jgi:hypothetical protein
MSFDMNFQDPGKGLLRSFTVDSNVLGQSEAYTTLDIISIEIWLRCDWTTVGDDDHCLLHMAGDRLDRTGSVRGEFALFISPDRKLLKIRRSPLTGTTVHEDQIEVPFNDGKFHFLTLHLRALNPHVPGRPDRHMRFSIDPTSVVAGKEIGVTDTSVSLVNGLPMALNFRLQEVVVGKRLPADHDSKTQFTGVIARLAFWGIEQTRPDAYNPEDLDDCHPLDAGVIGFLGSEQKTSPTMSFEFNEPTPQGLWILRGTNEKMPDQITDPDGLAKEDHVLYKMPNYVAFSEYEFDGQNFGLLLLDSEHFATLLPTATPNQWASSEKGHGSEFAVKLATSWEVVDQEDGSFELEQVMRVTESKAQLLPVGSYKRPAEVNFFGNVDQRWGDQFLHKPANFEFSLRGWNLTKVEDPIDPTDLGMKQFLFNPPALNSRDYTVTSVGAVPQGLHWEPRPVAHGSSKSVFASSGGELTSAMQASAGIKVCAEAGVESPVGGFTAGGSVNVRAGGELETKHMYDFETTKAVTSSWISQFVLVLDRARMVKNLDHDDDSASGFRKAVRKFARDVKSPPPTAEGQPDYITQFIDFWGTHYPYAICYGAKGYRISSLTQSSVQNAVDNGLSLQAGFEEHVKAEGGFAGVKGKASLSVSVDAEMHKKSGEMVKSMDRTELGEWKSYGTSTGADGVVSASEREALPMLLNLREIPELLGPPFFTDWDTAVMARRELRDGLKKYFKTHPAKQENSLRQDRVMTVVMIKRLKPFTTPMAAELLGTVPPGTFKFFGPKGALEGSFDVSNGAGEQDFRMMAKTGHLVEISFEPSDKGLVVKPERFPFGFKSDESGSPPEAPFIRTVESFPVEFSLTNSANVVSGISLNFKWRCSAAADFSKGPPKAPE